MKLVDKLTVVVDTM